MQKNDTTPMAPERQQEDAYRELVHRLIPGARQEDAHHDWLRGLNENSSLFAVPANYSGKLTRDLGHAIALAVGLNPDDPFVEVSRIRKWGEQHQRQLRSPKPNSVITSPFAAGRLMAFLELVDLALCDIGTGVLPASMQDGRSCGYVVKAGEFTQWVANPAFTRGEPAIERNAKRYQMCIDAGLVIPVSTYGALPRGIGKLAKRLKISTTAFSKSVKAHRETLPR